MSVASDRSRGAHNRRLGRFGERAAARHLRRLGYRVLAKNVAFPEGEIDLMCVNPERTALVVVEVKAGLGADGSGRIARPEAHVNREKADRVVRLARRAHAEHQKRVGAARLGLRIDVIGVDARTTGVLLRRFTLVDLRHHVNAVPA